MATNGQRRSSAPVCVAVGIHRTPWWTVWSLWSERGLWQIVWNPPEEGAWAEDEGQRVGRGRSARRGVADGPARLDAALDQYFAGRGVAGLQAISIDPTGWTEFFGQVYQACRAIPAGQTRGYGQLAAAVGRPRAVRAVGQAMARNRVPLVIPCHRVVGAAGSLGGFSAPGGLQTKQRLLELERSPGRSREPARRTVRR